jgi:hypothetical protein
LRTCDKYACAGLAEDFHQGTVIELTDDSWMNVETVELFEQA